MCVGHFKEASLLVVEEVVVVIGQSASLIGGEEE